MLDILTTKTQSGSTILNQNFLCREMTLVQHRTSQPTPLTARHTLPKVHFNPAYIALHRVHFKKNALLLSLLGSALLGLGFLGKEEESYMCHWTLHSFNNNPITNPSLQKKESFITKALKRLASLEKSLQILWKCRDLLSWTDLNRVSYSPTLQTLPSYSRKPTLFGHVVSDLRKA